MKNKGYAKFGGQIKCIMGDVQVAYKFRLAKQRVSRFFAHFFAVAARLQRESALFHVLSWT